MEQFGTELQSFFIAAIAIAIDEKGLSMQPLDPFRIGGDIRFEPEGAEWFLHPKRRLSRCPRSDAKRHDTRPLERLRRQVLQSRNALAQMLANFGQLTLISQR